MSATYWHASAREFAPGEVLLPPSKTGVVPNYTVGRPTTRVYMSSSVDEAELWATHLMHLSNDPTTRGKPVHLYEVSPRGRVFSKWLDDVEVVEFHAASAVVVAKRFTCTPGNPAVAPVALFAVPQRE